MNKKLIEAYDSFCEDYDFINNFNSKLKPVMLSDAMSYTHITGVYSFFTGEANVNIAFPDRKLYLFDTFEGFAAEDIETEKKESFSKMESNDFSDTSVSLVMKKMTHPENCVVKKGFFPETAEGVDATFSFVSIDCDLYDPILSGLRFFWDRLSPGGYIFVHEYNQTEYMGTNAAVNEFLEEHPEVHFFPLTDQGGSVVLIK